MLCYAFFFPQAIKTEMENELIHKLFAHSANFRSTNLNEESSELKKLNEESSEFIKQICESDCATKDFCKDRPDGNECKSCITDCVEGPTGLESYDDDQFDKFVKDTIDKIHEEIYDEMIKGEMLKEMGENGEKFLYSLKELLLSQTNEDLYKNTEHMRKKLNVVQAYVSKVLFELLKKKV